MTTVSHEEEATTTSNSAVTLGAAADSQDARTRARDDATSPAPREPRTDSDGPSAGERAGAAIRKGAQAAARHPARWRCWDYRPESARDLAGRLRSHPWHDHEGALPPLAITLGSVAALAWHVALGAVQAAPRSRYFWALALIAVLAWIAW